MHPRTHILVRIPAHLPVLPRARHWRTSLMFRLHTREFLREREEMRNEKWVSCDFLTRYFLSCGIHERQSLVHLRCFQYLNLQSQIIKWKGLLTTFISNSIFINIDTWESEASPRQKIACIPHLNKATKKFAQNKCY